MMKKIILIIVLIALAIGGYFLFIAGKDETEVKHEFAKVKKGEMIISIKESGFLNAVEEEKIKNESSVKQLTIVDIVENGSYIKKGDFLIELDSAPLLEEKFELEEKLLFAQVKHEEEENNLDITKSEVKSAVSSATSAIDFANLDLEKFEKLEKETMMDDALAEIDSARDAFKLSEQSYNTSVELADRGFETKSKVDQDKLDLAVKTLKLKSAQSQHIAVKDFDVKKQELRLKRDLEEALAKLEREKKQGESKIRKAEAAVTGALASVQSAETALQLIEEEIKKTKLYSPVSGYALYPKNSSSSSRESGGIEKGKTVYKKQTLLRIPNMEDMKIDVKVAEHFVSEVEVGQKVIVTIDSIKDKQFSAEVTKVSLLPVKQGFWEQAGSQKYEVEVNVDDTQLPNDIKPQISASAEIFVDRIEDATYVPIQAVHTEKGQQLVYVKANTEDGYEVREIKIGKINTTYIQVLEGVKEGEEVLISEP